MKPAMKMSVLGSGNVMREPNQKNSLSPITLMAA
jgi:hypothetical protein